MKRPQPLVTFVAFLFLAFALSLLPQESRAEIVIPHARGETTLAAAPQRVIVFDLAALDTLDALGVEVLGVPGSNLPGYLSKFASDRYLKVGSLFEPDYEAVYATKPDLIIIGGRSAAKYDELSRIAPTIDLTIDATDFVNGVKSNTALLGGIFGKETKAAELIAGLEGAIAKARDMDAGPGLVIMTNGNKITAHGAASRFGWVYSALGYEPAVAGLATASHGEVISFEFLAQTNPHWLVVVDRDAAVENAGQSAARTLDNELVASTIAAKTGRIVYADAVIWYLVGGGIAAFTKAVEDLGSALHGS